ncbi:MAG: hypothetical protein F4X40_06870, partial [Chloroflexi bacterium]|nr:hypothetical protein [Chloroflexota bacterium]
MPDKTSNYARILEVQNGAPLVKGVADQILGIRRDDPLSRIVVLVPSYFSAFFLRRAVTDEICNVRDGGFFNVEFMRIEELADRLFDATPSKPINPPMTRLVAFELIYNAMSALQTPGPLTEHANNESTLSAIQRTLQALERLDIGADRALSRLANGALTGLYAQLIEIQGSYAASSMGFLTRENKAAIAAETVTNNPEIVATALVPHIVMLQAPIPPDAYSRLRDCIQELSTTITFRITPDADSEEGLLGHAPSTRFYSTMGSADEPRALIRNIVADARSGVKFGEMAVLYASSDYASRIKDALEVADIESCGPSPNTLADTPTGKFVHLFLNMVAGEMRRDTFTSWTSSAPVVDPANGERVPSVPWEVASRNAKVSRFGGDDRWKRSLDRYGKSLRRRATRAEEAADEENAIDPDSMRALADAASQLEDFVQRLNRKTQPTDPRSWSEWTDWLADILETYGATVGNEEGVVGSGTERINDLLAEIRDLGEIGKLDVEFTRFSRTVQRALRTSLGGDSGWGTAILVAPLDASVGNSFRSVHILGMAEGGIPAPARSDPLLSDDLRRTLDPDGNRLPTRKEQLELDRQTFQLALQSAEKRNLYWNKALLGASNESYPSPWFVDEVIKSRNLDTVAVKSLMDPQSDYVDTVATLADLHESNLNPSTGYEFRMQTVSRRSLGNTSLDEFLADPINRALARGKDVSRSRKSGKFGVHDGNLTTAQNTFRFERRMSASSLQSYAECPYRYFLATELNVDERIDPEDLLVLSPLDKGLLVHAILERFLRDFGVDATELGLENLRKIAYEEFDRFQTDDFIGYPAIFELEKVQLLRQLERWHQANLEVLIEYDGEMKTEVPFGFGDSIGLTSVDESTSFQFRGMIDLIALSRDGKRALVADFKTGRSSYYSDIDKDVTAAGTKLQLPIYARVAGEILDGRAEISAAYWFVFQNGSTRLRPKIPVTLEETELRFGDVLPI